PLILAATFAHHMTPTPMTPVSPSSLPQVQRRPGSRHHHHHHHAADDGDVDPAEGTIAGVPLALSAASAASAAPVLPAGALPALDWSAPRPAPQPPPPLLSSTAKLQRPLSPAHQQQTQQSQQLFSDHAGVAAAASSSSHQHHRSIGNYDIVRAIGEGSFARVKLA
ncbi:hypothetical protein HK405_001247, partial [Cladochytrium tenue]